MPLHYFALEVFLDKVLKDLARVDNADNGNVCMKCFRNRSAWGQANKTQPQAIFQKMIPAYTQQLHCSFNLEHNSFRKHYTKQACKTKKPEERKSGAVWSNFRQPVLWEL